MAEYINEDQITKEVRIIDKNKFNDLVTENIHVTDGIEDIESNTDKPLDDLFSDIITMGMRVFNYRNVDRKCD